MKKSKYIEPSIKVTYVIPEGETCGVPVYFSVPGPGVAGAKQYFLEDMEEESIENVSPFEGKAISDWKTWEEQ